MVTFAEARQVVEDSAPGITTEPYGYEDDERWFPVVAPERDGGRVPAVSKQSGELTWMSSNADQYGSARLYGSRLTDDDEPTLDQIRAMAQDDDEDDEDDELLRAMAVDGDEFEAYWTRGKGLARWRLHPHPWRRLRGLLRKHPGIRDPEGLASHYFHIVFGYWPGSRKGDNPVGPG